MVGNNISGLALSDVLSESQNPPPTSPRATFGSINLQLPGGASISGPEPQAAGRRGGPPEDQEPGRALEALKLRLPPVLWISGDPSSVKRGASADAAAIFLRGGTRWPSELWRPPRLSSASEQGPSLTPAASSWPTLCVIGAPLRGSGVYGPSLGSTTFAWKMTAGHSLTT